LRRSDPRPSGRFHSNRDTSVGLIGTGPLQNPPAIVYYDIGAADKKSSAEDEIQPSALSRFDLFANPSANGRYSRIAVAPGAGFE
jgi:hypothetical protein